MSASSTRSLCCAHPHTQGVKRLMRDTLANGDLLAEAEGAGFFS